MTAVRVSQLCADGDTFLRGRDLEKATSLYMSAFRTHAVSAVSHMRKLDDLSLGQVVSTLESWLDGSGDIQPNGGLNKGLAAVFLSTLCPNNLTATIFKMESLLQNGGHNSEEICARCTTLLEGKRSPRPEGPTRVLLEITQALACLFSEPRGSTGLRLYLQTYQRNKPETVKLVQSRQAAHLPRIVKSFTDQIMQTRPSLAFDSRFGDSAEAYTALLRQEQNIPESATDASASPERTARLLTSRAAACLSAGGRSAEECRDLQAAFEIHPATARIHFQRLFADLGAGQAARNHLRQQAERGLSAFRERVLGRADLRATDGVELLDPVISALRTLCHLEADGGGRELRVRLADCLLLRGEHKEALSICSQLAAAQGQQSYQNTVQVLCGYARLLSGDHQGALEDFQAVIEHNAPHPSSCVRALCGRGLLRLMGGFNYLTGLDYVTASVLHPQETALTVRCLVPWNRRGLLVTVLLEQGRVMLEGKAGHKSKSASSEDPPQSKREGQLQAPSKRENHTQIMTPAGVQSLAALLTELQPGADGPQILAADSLYLLGRVEEAYRLLLSVGTPNPRAPVLARLALLQLHRGFLYDTNQLLKKLIVCGDTSCLRSLLAVAQEKDRAALQRHCHSAAKRILDGSKGESSVREAVAYLSIAIMASGGDAADSLLERARCYVLLGQRKTAIFDFSAILREKPKHMHGLCGRGFTHLMLNQQKECIQDVLAALQINTDIVIKEVLSLKDRARKLLCDWLHHFCRTNLSDTVTANSVPCHEEQLRDAFTIGGALLRTDSRDPRWHLLYVDTLLAKGEFKAASTHLCQVFGQEPRDAVAQARLGVVEAWQQNYCSATRRLSKVIEKESSSLDFLLALIPFNQRKCTAQAAAQEASGVSSAGQWDQALALLTVAVKAAGDHKLLYLRQRAACFSQLGLHEQAVADLDRVIRRHGDSSCSDDLKIRAEDLCRRGRSLVLCSREGAALEDFSQALSLHRMQMVQCAEAGPGRLHLAECFLRGALQRYEEQQLSEAWRLIECGLAVDGENAELRRLRARVKREATGPCNIN
ncbi:tetratricopeptide repeat protein 34 isoform X2 [Kryptolebias marmoratus]|uniref:tetratricopeptide repeat protein 34 isoform X2 n=1 Tax=Kryptolebias marmoratus TaxID=37003 RepID=UPI000D52FB73|nr:tetratricopeptide repeat protein 34 isoform X2 [Kryptolebias marmoratus]